MLYLLQKQLDTAEKKLAYFKLKKIKGGLSIETEFALNQDIENLTNEILKLKQEIKDYPNSNNKLKTNVNFIHLLIYKLANVIEWIVNTFITIGTGICYFLVSLSFFAVIIIIALFFAKNLDGCNFPSLGSNSQTIQTEKQHNIDSIKVEKAGNLTIYEFFSYDDNGNKVDWIMYIVNHGYWQKNKVAESVNNEQKFNICEYMSETKIVDRINKDNLIGIICFGNASKEEEISLENEEERALTRAEKLSSCIEPIISTGTPVHTLNLGKYLKEDIPSKEQRKILIIGIKENALQADEENALFNGLVDKKNSIGFDIRNYSLVKNNKLKITKKIN